jgi:hypothetical protein
MVHITTPPYTNYPPLTKVFAMLSRMVLMETSFLTLENHPHTVRPLLTPHYPCCQAYSPHHNQHIQVIFFKLGIAGI